MIILGVNAYHPDASCAILIDGKLIAAAEEERFTRIKHCGGFPANALKYCLKEANLKVSDIDYIAVSRRPAAHLLRRLKHLLGTPARLPGLLTERLRNTFLVYNIKGEISRTLHVDPKRIRAKLNYIEHHLAHLASAFYPSGFNRAVLLSADAFGDFVSTAVGIGEGKGIKLLERVFFPHSLGILYTSGCQFIGFPQFGDEGKVMALAAYGSPSYLSKLQELIRLKPHGLQFELQTAFFRHHKEGIKMTWGPQRPCLGRFYSQQMPEYFGPVNSQDFAASLQKVLEEIVLGILYRLYDLTRINSLGLAGGVFYNCALNSRILDESPFDNVFIQPASGDSGTAIGAAFYTYHAILNRPRTFLLEHLYWGPQFQTEYRRALEAEGLRYRRLDNIEVMCAKALCEGKIIGWFQDRMELGPRALGNRSILADPRRAQIKEILNKRIKHREPFRPFAPSIMEEYTGAYFKRADPAPFMITVDRFLPEKGQLVPAVVHVDGSGRLQTVTKGTNPRFWGLLAEFFKITGVPMVLNTSFNEDEPIVCSPQDAIRCFKTTHIDVLVLGDYWVE